MRLLKRIRSWRAERRAEEAALSPSAREYNALLSKSEKKGILTMLLTTFTPGGIALATVPFIPDPTVAVLTAGMAFLAGFTGALVTAEITSSRIPRAVREIQEAFYISAGIEENFGFYNRLKPGATVATFPRTLPDGRKGHVEVVCDSSGNPQLLFKENPTATFIGAPSLGVSPQPTLKELTA